MTGSEGRGVKQAPFRVLVGAAMPAVLVEVAFISNPEEEKLLPPTPTRPRSRRRSRAGGRDYESAAGRRERAISRPADSARPKTLRRAVMTSRRANLLTVLGLACLLALVWPSPRPAGPASCPRAVGPDDDEPRRSRPRAAAARGGAAAEPPHQREALLPGGRPRGLLSEEREVAFSSDLAAADPHGRGGARARARRRASSRRCPPETKVLEVFVTARGVAYVDLSKEVAARCPSGRARPSC